MLSNFSFLAVLRSLAEIPDLVKSLFVTQTKNDAGIYLVNFFVNGVLTPVVIDDYLPTLQNKLAFAGSKSEGEIWVCLLEKAWAKLYGTYARMEGGNPAFVWTHLQGTVAECYDHKEFRNDRDSTGKELERLIK